MTTAATESLAGSLIGGALMEGVSWLWSLVATNTHGTHPKLSGLFCGAFGLFGVFLIWEHHKGGTAMISLVMYRRRVVCLGYSIIFLQFGALLLLTYWLPIWFQVVKGEGPEMSGAMILPTLIPQALISTISGKLVSTIGYYTPFALGGSMLTAIGWH
jgi:hypothetical protein